MPGQLLPLRPLDSPRVLGRAFPFKLKYHALFEKPRRPFFPGDVSLVQACPRRPAKVRRADLRARSATGREQTMTEGDAAGGDWTGDRKGGFFHVGGGEPGRDIAGSSKGKNDVGIGGIVANRVSLKRRRQNRYNGSRVVDERRESLNSDIRSVTQNLKDSSLSRKNLDRNLDEKEEEASGYSAERRSGDGLSSSELKRGGRDIKPSHGLGKGYCIVPGQRSSPDEDESYLSETRFERCSISPMSLQGIRAAGYERMTLVQEATLPVILEGKDVLAKARTGTGKTVAFLLPAIEVVSKLPPVDRDQKRPSVNVLVICPTRELASQAAAEANKLTKYHPSIGVQVVFGGTRITQEQKRMQANPCQILVATPGRLKDHIENTPGFATRLMGLKLLVLDEADRLLDMGFRKDIEKIVGAVPKQRQTLLFSATVPDEVHQICGIAMKKDYQFISTVEEGSEETHSQVRQMHLVAELDKHFSILYCILREHISQDVDYKVIVFCTTAMVTKLVADLLSKLCLNVREIHSRKAQNHRTRVSEEFKQSKGLILVSSDVSARGVDYPDVTLVVQMGLPAGREQYIHRLGRTGRKGKEGKGILMLAPWEKYFLANISDLPITEGRLPPTDSNASKEVGRALSQVELKTKETAYQAWLGYYNSVKTIGRDKRKLVELAREFSQSMGLDSPPAIPKLILRKMGLNNVPGLLSK